MTSIVHCTRVDVAALMATLCGSTAGCAEEAPANELRVSGHVEATEVHVAAEVGGRLVELRVDEGDRVDAGAVIARLDTRDTELQIDRVRAERDAAEAQLRLLAGRSARRGRPPGGGAGGRGRGGRRRRSTPRSSRRELDLARFESLLAANAGSQKQRDDAQARVDGLRERQRGARERVRVAREAVARVRGGRAPRGGRRPRARASAAVDAQIAVLEKSVADAVVKAPAAGIVTQNLVDAGEIVAPRTPLVVVTDLDRAWANLFVPEPMVPRIKLGQAATVLTDAGQMLPGKVTFVSPRAEFTPRNVQTADERSKLVYRIKVSVDNSRRRPEAGHAGGRRDGAASERRRRARSPAVEKRYGADDGARRADPRRRAGEMFGLIGPDGAGKTTAIRADVRPAAPRRGRPCACSGATRSASIAVVTERVGLPVAALQPVRRSDHRREHRVLRRDPRRARLPAAPRSAARDDAARRRSGRGWPIGCRAA